jgi:hypothetical protein
VLKKSRITKEDFPLNPWHTFYDWNYFVEVDPQFKYLLNEMTAEHHKLKGSDGELLNVIECEWDTAFVPLWALPPVGSRIWIYGRWIFDCGHPEDDVHRLEIHPPKATAWYRSEAVQFEGNSGPTRANNAVLYIGRKGGYIDQAINNEDYEFDIPLPPKPHPDAVALVKFRKKTSFPVALNPRFSPFPDNDPKVIRVTVPLKGAPSSLDEYGAIIAAGWSDPAGTEVRRVKRFRVTLKKVKILVTSPNEGTWLFFVAINGLWHRRRLLLRGAELIEEADGDFEIKPVENIIDLNITQNLDLHDEDHVQITACGFKPTNIFGFMGGSSGVSPTLTREGSSHDHAIDASKKIGVAFAKLILDKGFPFDDENVPIHNFSSIRKPHEPGVIGQNFTDTSDDFLGPSEDKALRGYELEYRIDEV